MKKRLLLACGLALLWILPFATPVLAIDPPDDIPTLINIKANRWLIEQWDVLIYGEYLIPYATPPSEVGADEAYVFRLYNGATELAQISPFALMDNGYNKGVFAFYFPASTNLTWGVAYTIRISQNPAYFSSANYTDYTMPLSAYTSQTTQEANQLGLASNIINAANRMTVYYDAQGYDFSDTSVGGTVLSSPTGETYFRGAIYGIQAMAPDLFIVQTLAFDTSDRVWGTTQGDNFTSRFDNTFVSQNTTAVANEFGFTPGGIMGLLFTLPLIIGSVVVSSMRFRKTEPGIMAAALFVMMAAFMSWLPIPIFATVYQLAGIYLAWTLMGSRGDAGGVKWINFLSMAWFFSILICLLLEGSQWGSVENGVLNDLALFTNLKLGGLIGIPAAALNFTRGVFRTMTFDYSFYTGGYVLLRAFWLLAFIPGTIWAFHTQMSSIFANFLRIFR